MERTSSSDASSSCDAPSSRDRVSTQKSLPSSYNPGWNDPPDWALSLQRVSNEAVTKRFLNKRVAFPLFSTSASVTSNSTPPSDMPPTSQPHLEITPALRKLASEKKTHLCMTAEDASGLDEHRALFEVLASLKYTMIGQRMEPTKKKQTYERLNDLKSDWLENKLNDAIQKTLLVLSEALLKKDADLANKIHTTLMNFVDYHTNLHPHWTFAIRHIILGMRKDTEES